MFGKIFRSHFPYTELYAPEGNYRNWYRDPSDLYASGNSDLPCNGCSEKLPGAFGHNGYNLQSDLHNSSDAVPAFEKKLAFSSIIKLKEDRVFMYSIL